jgi:hypothetical protein
VLSSGWQMPLQLCVPEGQTPSHAWATGTQAPLQSFLLVSGQDGTHARPVHVTSPPAGFWQGVSHAVVPHVAGSVLLTQRVPQRWYPVRHARSHVPPVQIRWPLGSFGQATQPAPQAVASSSEAQRSLQRWYPEPQLKPHAVPSHDALVAPTGRGQVAHDDVPHEFTLSFAAQTPAQLCVPGEHMPAQAIAMSMQPPLQSFLPGGQLPPHDPPVQVALPPAGAAHAVHELPQVAGLVSSTQRPSQRW